MNNVIAIARREIGERSFVFIVAVVVTVLPLLTIIVPRSELSDRVMVSMVLSAALLLGLGFILGLSMVGRELTEKRLSFYFSRPVSGASIWFGKLTACVAIVLGCAVIMLIPSLLFQTQLSTSWIPMPLVIALIVGISLLFVLVGHGVSTTFRSRSPLLAADFAAAIVFVFALAAMLTPLMVRHAQILAASVAGFVLLVFVFAVVVGGAWQLSRGRIDGRRNHAAFSQFFWTSMGAALAIIAAFTLWVTSVTPNDLVRPFGFHAPGGSWMYLSGESSHRADYGAAFLIDASSGKSIPVPQQFRWFGSFNSDGSVAEWVEPTNPMRYMFASNTHLMSRSESLAVELLVAPLRGDAKARHTGILFNSLPRDIEVTSDLSRAAVFADGSLSVFDVASRKLLGSAHFDLAWASSVEIHFAGPDVVQFFTAGRDEKTGEWSASGYAFNVRSHSLAKLLDATPVGAGAFTPFFTASPDGRTLVVRTARGTPISPMSSLHLFDLTAGREVAALLPADGERISGVWLLRDGRLAAGVIVNGEGHLRIYDKAALQSDVVLGRAAMLEIDGETAAGQVLIWRFVPRENVREAMLIDRNGVVAARLPGVVSMMRRMQTVGVTTDNEVVPVYFQPGGALVTWNPATGATKRVL
jgi:ABC-type transport system involved in multi-copper enzyme maturation permease subunit